MQDESVLKPKSKELSIFLNNKYDAFLQGIIKQI